MSISSDPALIVNQLPISIELPSDPREMREILTLWMKRVANAVNYKEGSLYNLIELYSFKQYYNIANVNTFRNVYRSVFDMTTQNATLPNTPIAPSATVSFAHNITGLMFGTMIYAGCTTTQPRYFSVMGETSVWLDPININFTNTSTFPITACTVVAEYLKN